MLIDIGSGSVGVALIECDEDFKKPLILYTHREDIRFGKEKNAETLIHSLKEALLAATLEFSGEGNKILREHNPHATIDHIDVLYASPWSEVVTRAISFEKKDPFKLTQRFIDNIITEALKAADATRFEQSLFDIAKLTVVNKEVAELTINGYVIHDYIGKEATELRIELMSELVPEVVREALTETERNLSVHAKLNERTFMHAFADACGRLYPNDRVLAIDVTGEAVECAIVERGFIHESKTMLFGIHTFYRHIAAALNTVEDEVRMHIADYVSGTTHDDVSMVIMSVRAEFLSVLEKLFTATAEKQTLPSTVLLVTEPEMSVFLSTLLEESYHSYRSDAHVTTLTTEALTFIEYADNTVHDVPLSIGASFFHTTHKKQTPSDD